MKRYLRMMFALLMVVAVMFAYTGISFAADDEPTDTNGSGEPTTTVTEPTEGTGGESNDTPTEPTTTLGAGDTSGTKPEEPITEPAAGSGNQTGDSNGEPTRGSTQYTVTYEYTGEVPEGQTAPAEEQYAAGIEVTLKDAPSASGYTFGGWTVKAGEEAVTVTEGKFSMPASNVTVSGSWAKDPVDISTATISLAYTAIPYIGSSRNPTVTVVADGKTLTVDTDYTVAYSNNTYPGTAKATITGKGNYKGTVEKEYKINLIAVTGLKASSQSNSSITASWNKYADCSYNVYLNGKFYKNVSGTACTISGLAIAKGYTIGVEPCVNKVNGPRTNKTMYTAPAAPGKVTLKTAKTKKPYVQLTYSASTNNVYGYQVQYSLYSNFAKPGYYTYSGASKKAVNVPNLFNGRTYYFRVRAYNLKNGVASYGSWSNVKAAKANSSGWMSGMRYYAVNGVLLKGYHKVGGERYYFDEVTGENGGASKEIWNEIKRSKSKTKYLVSVSIKNHRVNVFTKKSGKWVIKYQWKCITGMNDTTEKGEKFTPRGSWIINGKKLKYMSNKGHTCYLATNFYGGCFIHSELYAPEMTMKKIIDGKLGESRSSGCVRVQYKNAQWVYKNIKKGTRVISRFA